MQKLGVREGKNAVFLHVPSDIESSCKEVPVGARVSHRLERSHDLIFGFYESSQLLKVELPQLKVALNPTGMIWVCWRKDDRSDLTRDLIWQLGEECGLQSVSSVALDQAWSAMKMMYPKQKRRERIKGS